jgi:rubrerythrin
MERKPWIPGIAVAVAAGMLLPFVVGHPTLRTAVLVVCGLGLIGATGGLLNRRRRDRYDLDALREIHEREAIRALLDNEPTPDSDTVVCRNCGTCYAANIGVCPECGCISGH